MQRTSKKAECDELEEAVLFSGAIYDNLMMANPQATFEQAIHACTMAEIYHVIDRLPQGYQTEIDERRRQSGSDNQAGATIWPLNQRQSFPPTG